MSSGVACGWAGASKQPWCVSSPWTGTVTRKLLNYSVMSRGMTDTWPQFPMLLPHNRVMVLVRELENLTSFELSWPVRCWYRSPLAWGRDAAAQVDRRQKNRLHYGKQPSGQHDLKPTNNLVDNMFLNSLVISYGNRNYPPSRPFPSAICLLVNIRIAHGLPVVVTYMLAAPSPITYHRLLLAAGPRGIGVLPTPMTRSCHG
ncbi:hypothetical protein BC936DRAFT_146119 [Jimgerdemannia flammicorona]|uniref:Uncharacterized protein n=1 Tax=Jimgerdemannia flammicorona TaxID=994334 RepID=A0A433DLM6_9FUNG|nr:hypothetical protein BC936DRAFT_146119 [Jimgerdemannia flammicorona]